LFCGIPDADAPPDPVEPVAPVDAGAADVELGAAALLAELEEEPPPQPATAKATTTRARPRKWRGCFLIFVFMVNKTPQPGHPSRRAR
jgi:hypothetical protein